MTISVICRYVSTNVAEYMHIKTLIIKLRITEWFLGGKFVW